LTAGIRVENLSRINRRHTPLRLFTRTNGRQSTIGLAGSKTQLRRSKGARRGQQAECMSGHA